MKSFVTSFAQLFEHRSDVPVVRRIKIPLIQRDYAQGRESEEVTAIRNNFLDSLHAAVTGGKPVGLDFVYGQVDEGTLQPLDGQQRLTTLFLLHWYLAYRTGQRMEDQGWIPFAYATRPGARLFCKKLVTAPPPADEFAPSTWIRDQDWYLYVWRHDPTIQSMLVMIDAIHARFAAEDVHAAWEYLVDPDAAAISFHLLPIENMGAVEQLYIKMNSRGKPLTEFETFKARFEQALEGTGRASEFAHKVDGAWSDLLWPMHGGDNIVDDEFIRYIRFVTEICEWRHGRSAEGRLEIRAERAFGSGQPHASENLEFLFAAFDTWVGSRVPATFETFFSHSPTEPAKVVLFGSGVNLNLLEECCHTHGDVRGNTRVFSLSQSLLLYAVLLHRIKDTRDFPRRLRILRNLAEASVNNELRLDRMPDLIADVERIVVEGELDDVSGFNQAQVEDERLKAAFLAEHPSLEPASYKLEDHPLLRGSLAAFELNAEVFRGRADAFEEIMATPAQWPLLTAALLAVGNYARPRNARDLQFGSPENDRYWRYLLTDASHAKLQNTRETLARLLDVVAGAGGSTVECLSAIRRDWLEAREKEGWFDWQYYIVKYDVMRAGRSGIYASVNGAMGYSVCMLNVTQLNSNYRDPYLLAIVRQSHAQDAIEGGADGPWFTGWETIPRWMRLKRSGVQMRCVDNGLALQGPVDDAQLDAFRCACENHNVNADLVLVVPQVEREGARIDTQDRVDLARALLTDLIEAGL